MPGLARYAQLAAHLRARIESGQLPAGARIPAETDLATEHGMSRETVRRAVALLRADGLVDVEPGRGTRVRTPERADDRVLVHIPRYSSWIVRMPTSAERAEYEIPDGVPVMAVRHGGRTSVYPGDRFRFDCR